MRHPLRILALAAATVAVGASAAPVAADSSSLIVDYGGFIAIDPAEGYLPATQSLLYATGLKLVNYPDKAGQAGARLVGEASPTPTASADWKEYTFAIKPGFRFSDGSAVRPENFAFALNRVLRMHSQGADLLSDVVGAGDVVAGKAREASGIHALQDKLVVDLTHPDYNLAIRLGTPYFVAMPTSAPDTFLHAPYASAGPYFISAANGQDVVLSQNPYYPGPRPHAPGQIVLHGLVKPDDALADVKEGRAEAAVEALTDPIYAELGKTYGVNKSQFFAHPLTETDYVALNTSRATFRSLKARQAANFAIDRPAMLRQRGAFAGTATDQILPPGMVGFTDAHIYPLDKPNLTKARALAGKTKRHARLYSCNLPQCVDEAKVVASSFGKIGIQTTIVQFAPEELDKRLHTPKEPFDAVIRGWSSEYPDPFDFIDVLLNGNNNLAHYNTAALEKQLAAASKLAGSARYKAYSALDIDLTAHGAPWVAFDNRNERDFVSAHVKNYVFQPVYGGMDLTAVQLR
jgi:peptide/nickel transport system substrate-binding protein